MQTERRPTGFSRVALVVVCTGIVLLLWLLYLTFCEPGRRIYSRRARCLSNLKQIGLAIRQYALDNDDVFPWNGTESQGYHRFLGKLHPSHVASVGLLSCPSSGDVVMNLHERGEDGSLFTEAECRTGLSYAYGHNHGRPWTERDPSSTRLAADKYATHDYQAGPYPERRPLNHSRGVLFWTIKTRNVRRFGSRNYVCIDGSAHYGGEITPLEADPETEFENSGDPEHDQTGTDWWSDPPDKWRGGKPYTQAERMSRLQAYLEP